MPALRQVADIRDDLERALVAWSWSALAAGYTQGEVTQALHLLRAVDGLRFLAELIEGRLPDPEVWQSSCYGCRLATIHRHRAPGRLLWSCERCARARRR
jgi:hypothetical protein